MGSAFSTHEHSGFLSIAGGIAVQVTQGLDLVHPACLEQRGNLLPGIVPLLLKIFFETICCGINDNALLSLDVPVHQTLIGQGIRAVRELPGVEWQGGLCRLQRVQYLKEQRRRV